MNQYRSLKNLPPPGLDVSKAFLRKLPLATSLKAMQMRRRFSRNPERDPMRLFAQTQAIFVRVPKNASSSLVEMLYADASASDLPHFSAEFYRRVFPDQFKSWLVFALLRNPIDRLASAFTYYREKTTVPAERRLMDEELPFLKSFADFVYWLNDQRDICAPGIMKWHHFRRQADFVCDKNGTVITNLLFPVEDMTKGIARLRAYAGINGDLPRLNVTRPRDWAKLPLEKLNAYFEADFDLWGRCMAASIIETP